MRVIPLELSELANYPIVAPDCETTGKHWYRDKLFGVAIAACDPKAKVMARGYWDVRDNRWVMEALRRELPRCKRIVNHSMKFDAHFLINEGVPLPLDRLECTMVRAALINENEGKAAGRNGFDLDTLAKKYLGREKVNIYPELAAMFGGAPTRAIQIKNLHRAPAALAAKYAIVDPELAILLWLWQEEEIRSQELEQIWSLERALMPVLIKMERRGVRVNEAGAAQAIKDTDRYVHKAQRALDRLAGKEVNVNSPPQMRIVFGVHKDGEAWKTGDGTLLETTDGGAACLDKDAMIILRDLGDERAAQVLTIRRMLKAQSFLKDHIIGHALNGRVFPNYNQTRGDNELGTGTGRFSVDDPALQQIPSRDKDVAAIVRALFEAERNCQWGCADWEQFEFRWFAHYTNDPAILSVYRERPDADYHGIVAEITGIPRNPRFAGDANAKQINLGLVFGMGRGEMAYQMGLDFTLRTDSSGRSWKTAGNKANAIFDAYHSAIPGVKKLLDQASSIARSRGYVQTAYGRHIRFPHGKYTHKAAGLVFQGTSADCMKLKMVEMDPVCEKEGWPMLASIHDELGFSVPTRQTKRASAYIKRSLETFDGDKCPIQCRVPILSNVAFGPNWWEASK